MTITLVTRARHDLLAALGAVRRASDAAEAMFRARAEPPSGPVFLLAIGKASVEMALAASTRMARRAGAERLVGGVVIAVPERICPGRLPSSVRVFAADHPHATQRNVEAAESARRAVKAFVGEHGERGVVWALISGGGSAHLTLPDGELLLEDLRNANDLFQRAGAPISALNTVRKHTEQLKGGRLAALCWPALVDVCVLSDVMGDPIDVIASGPFAPDPSTFADASRATREYGISAKIPGVVEHLQRGERGEIPETPKPGDGIFDRVNHRVIANNGVAVMAAAEALRELGYEVVVESRWLAGEAAAAAETFVQRVVAGTRHVNRPTAWVLGGEATVRVGDAQGRGGPSQEFALAALIAIERAAGERNEPSLLDRIAVLTYSTDGIDGPTTAAGALVLPGMARLAREGGLDLHAALLAHDSFSVLGKLGALIVTGPTGTNVNHVVAAVVYQKP